MMKEYITPSAVVLVVNETLLMDTSSIPSAGSNTTPEAPKIAETKFDTFDGLEDALNGIDDQTTQPIVNQ